MTNLTKMKDWSKQGNYFNKRNYFILWLYEKIIYIYTYFFVFVMWRPCRICCCFGSGALDVNFGCLRHFYKFAKGILDWKLVCNSTIISLLRVFSFPINCYIIYYCIIKISFFMFVIVLLFWLLGGRYLFLMILIIKGGSHWSLRSSPWFAILFCNLCCYFKSKIAFHLMNHQWWLCWYTGDYRIPYRSGD